MQSTPVTQNTQNTPIVCPLNCVCCYNYQRRRPCFCYAEKRTASTQTDGHDYMKIHSDEKTYFTRGTFAHTLMQKCILTTITKYNLESRKDVNFATAILDVLTGFPDIQYSTDMYTKIGNRIAKAISWQKFADKKRKSTSNEQQQDNINQAADNNNPANDEAATGNDDTQNNDQADTQNDQAAGQDNQEEERDVNEDSDDDDDLTLSAIQQRTDKIQERDE